MLFVSLTLCVVVLGITLALAKRDDYGRALTIQPFILLFGCGCLGGLPLVILPLLLGTLCIVAKAQEPTLTSFGRWAVSLTAVALVVGSLPALLTVRHNVAQQKEYPFEDISGRLVQNVPDNESPRLKRAALKYLNQAELQLSRAAQKTGSRARALEHLHENMVMQFVNNAGFGIARMAGLNRSRVTSEDPGPIKQPEPVQENYSPEAIDENGASFEAAPPPTYLLKSMHINGVSDFVNSNGFGYRRSDGLVAGFESHRFSKTPRLTVSDVSQAHPHPDWQLIRVELVSLLKQDEPLVYVSDNLPRMDKLRTAPTRRVNSFERSAIHRLRGGENIVTEDQGEHYLVVGSLRALRQCVECHSARRGDLLGAFSYQFRSRAPRDQRLSPEA